MLLFIIPMYSFASTTKTFENFDIRISKSDQLIASHLKKTFKLADKGIYTYSLIKKLDRDISKNENFKPFKYWTQNTLSILKNRNLASLKKQCSILSEKQFSSQLHEYLNKSLIDNCFNRYLGFVAKNAKFNLSYHKSENEFIKFHTKYIINDFQMDDLEFLLSRFKRNDSIHRLYSDTILNYYMALKLNPPTDLLQQLSLQAKHTRYIQEHDLDIINTHYVFYNEFKKLKEDAFETVDKSDKGKDDTKTVEKFNQALNYFNLTIDNQPKEKAFLTLQSLAKSYMRRGYYSLARKGFTEILSFKSHYYDSVMFDLIWSHILEKSYDGVMDIQKKYSLSKEYLLKNPKTYFWIAKAHIELGQNEVATSIFKEIIKENPLHYYAILSGKLLAIDPEKNSNHYQNIIQSNTHIATYENKNLNHAALKRILLWGKIHQPQFMELELADIKNSSKSEYIEQNLMGAASLLSRHKEYLKSFQIIYKAIDQKHISLNKTGLEILFPKPYFKQIKYNSKSFDPIIALSLIRQESGFNATARSHVGARGLMQLMPNTARQMKRRLNTRQLYNPKLNIKLGTTFFERLLGHYDENLVYSLAAYNAGKRRVDEWQGSYLNKDSILVNIENIPFTETRKYVKLIFRNIFFYKMLDDSNATDTHNLNKIYDINLGFIR